MVCVDNDDDDGKWASARQNLRYTLCPPSGNGSTLKGKNLFPTLLFFQEKKQFQQRFLHWKCYHSSEANWYGNTLFANAGYIRVQLDKG